MTWPYPDNVRAMASFGHVNLVAHDWRALAAFYEHVFGCEPVGAERDISGDWVERTTGVRGAHITGRHLRLPGHGPDGPTLEIFSYDRPSPQSHPTADRLGFAHIAFRVDDVAGTLQRLLEAGGRELGEVVEADVAGESHLEVVYARDPESNIVELQRWT
jgi:catechol 2,3-dioxygenase-like lactoylglutathione lyase family enzyme